MDEVDGQEAVRVFTGSVRWRRSVCATWPLAKLTVGPEGFGISPSWRGIRIVWRMFGLPLRHWEWSEVERAAPARSVLGGTLQGVSLTVAGKRLDFGYIAPAEVLEEIRRFVPLKVSDQPVRIFS